MKSSKNNSESIGMSEILHFNAAESEPILRKSPASMTGCRLNQGERAANTLSKKWSPATRTGRYLNVIALTVCALVVLFSCGPQGKPETQESGTKENNLRLIIQVTNDAGNPLSGTWLLNPLKSEFPSDFLFPQSHTTHAVVDASDIEITQETITESGERFNMKIKARFDGEDYPITDLPGAYSVAYHRVDANTIKAVMKSEGKVILRQTGVISPDGKSLTVDFSIAGANGNQINGVAVFEKK